MFTASPDERESEGVVAPMNGYLSSHYVSCIVLLHYLLLALWMTCKTAVCTHSAYWNVEHITSG